MNANDKDPEFNSPKNLEPTSTDSEVVKTESPTPPKLPVPETPLDTSIIDSIRKLAQTTAASSTKSDILSAKPQKISEKIERARSKKIENDNAEKDQALKEKTLKILFIFLSLETIAIFMLALLQGFTWKGFGLDEWSFRLVITATIGQITAMLTIAIYHLFPKR